MMQFIIFDFFFSSDEARLTDDIMLLGYKVDSESVNQMAWSTL